MFTSSNSFLVSGIATNKNLQDAQLNLNKNYFQIMTYEQFQQTEFYKTTFEHMLSEYSEKFTRQCLKDFYFRKEYAGTLDTLK